MKKDVKKGLIYVSYDAYEYMNYFHLVMDEEFVCKGVPDGKTDELFGYLDQENIKDSEIAWCIIADQDATDWEYKNAFAQKGRNIHAQHTIDVFRITELLKKEFFVDFTFDQNEHEGKLLQMLFPKQGEINREEPAKEKTKPIPDRKKQEPKKTEFSEIIREKLRREALR